MYNLILADSTTDETQLSISLQEGFLHHRSAVTTVLSPSGVMIAAAAMASEPLGSPLL